MKLLPAWIRCMVDSEVVEWARCTNVVGAVQQCVSTWKCDEHPRDRRHIWSA